MRPLLRLLLTPVLDTSITPEERRAVELLVLNELSSTNTNTLHPRVQLELPLSSNSPRPLLLLDVERMDMEDPEGESIGGISMDRYTHFDAEAGPDCARIYTALSYAVLRERNASLQAQNGGEHVRLQQAYVDSLTLLGSTYEHELQHKRRHVDDINVARKRRQMDFEPVAAYLELRWLEGIKGLVDVGLELRPERS